MLRPLVVTCWFLSSLCLAQPRPGEASALPTMPRPAVTEARCGNGVLDVRVEQRCAPCLVGLHCPCAEVRVPLETCDGPLGPSMTCAQQGYFGGALACSKTCQFDPSGCQVAARPSLALPRFGPMPEGASRGELAVLVAGDPQGLRGARLVPGASKVEFTELASGSFGEVKLVATARGFLITALHQVGKVEARLFFWSPEGKVTEKASVSGFDPVALVASPEGPVVVLLSAGSNVTGYTLHAMMLDAQGEVLAAPRPLGPQFRSSFVGAGAAVWTSGRFLVASSDRDGGQHPPALAWVTTKGDVTALPALTTKGSDARFSTSAEGLRLHFTREPGRFELRLDAQGAPRGEERKLHGKDEWFARSADGAPTVVQAPGQARFLSQPEPFLRMPGLRDLRVFAWGPGVGVVWSNGEEAGLLVQR